MAVCGVVIWLCPLRARLHSPGFRMIDCFDSSSHMSSLSKRTPKSSRSITARRHHELRLQLSMSSDPGMLQRHAAKRTSQALLLAPELAVDPKAFPRHRPNHHQPKSDGQALAETPQFQGNIGSLEGLRPSLRLFGAFLPLLLRLVPESGLSSLVEGGDACGSTVIYYILCIIYYI